MIKRNEIPIELCWYKTRKKKEKKNLMDDPPNPRLLMKDDKPNPQNFPAKFSRLRC